MSGRRDFLKKTLLAGGATLVAGGAKLGAATAFRPGLVYTLDAPESSFALPDGFKGTLWATSFCNIHDLWLAELTI